MEFTRLSKKELSEAEYSALFESARCRALAQAYGLLATSVATALLLGVPQYLSPAGGAGLLAALFFLYHWRQFSVRARTYRNHLPAELISKGFVPGFWLSESSPSLLGLAFLLAFSFALWRQTRLENSIFAVERRVAQLEKIPANPGASQAPAVQGSSSFQDLAERVTSIEASLKKLSEEVKESRNAGDGKTHKNGQTQPITTGLRKP